MKRRNTFTWVKTKKCQVIVCLIGYGLLDINRKVADQIPNFENEEISLSKTPTNEFTVWVSYSDTYIRAYR